MRLNVWKYMLQANPLCFTLFQETMKLFLVISFQRKSKKTSTWIVMRLWNCRFYPENLSKEDLLDVFLFLVMS